MTSSAFSFSKCSISSLRPSTTSSTSWPWSSCWPSSLSPRDRNDYLHFPNHRYCYRPNCWCPRFGNPLSVSRRSDSSPSPLSSSLRKFSNSQISSLLGYTWVATVTEWSGWLAFSWNGALAFSGPWISRMKQTTWAYYLISESLDSPYKSHFGLVDGVEPMKCFVAIALDSWKDPVFQLVTEHFTHAIKTCLSSRISSKRPRSLSMSPKVS